jgi:hypothetical protein
VRDVEEVFHSFGRLARHREALCASIRSACDRFRVRLGGGAPAPHELRLLAEMEEIGGLIETRTLAVAA